MIRRMTQLAFQPFGEEVELTFHPRRRRPEIRLVPRRQVTKSKDNLSGDARLEAAIERCERAAAECEEMARSAAKSRNACWAAYGATKRIKESA